MGAAVASSLHLLLLALVLGLSQGFNFPPALAPSAVRPHFVRSHVCSSTRPARMGLRAAKAQVASAAELPSLDTISSASLQLVKNGEAVGPQIPSSNLWKDGPSVVFVVRRPG